MICIEEERVNVGAETCHVFRKEFDIVIGWIADRLQKGFGGDSIMPDFYRFSSLCCFAALLGRQIVFATFFSLFEMHENVSINKRQAAKGTHGTRARAFTGSVCKRSSF